MQRARRPMLIPLFALLMVATYCLLVELFPLNSRTSRRDAREALPSTRAPDDAETAAVRAIAATPPPARKALPTPAPTRAATASHALPAREALPSTRAPDDAVRAIAAAPPPAREALPTPAPTLAAAASRACVWRFLSYTPSAYEQDWVANVSSYSGSVCETANQRPELADAWVREVASANAGLEIAPSVLSRFEFENTCSMEVAVEYIEPLAGLTRHPWFCLRGGRYEDLIDKSYLLVTHNISKHRDSPRAFYFDLGASKYTSGIGGASQSWFVETYRDRGIEFDGIYAWEATPIPAAEVFAEIPADVQTRYHWHNVPASTAKGDPENPLEALQRVARREDFVLLKLDVDLWTVEEEFVRQILASAELTGLIDEFFFEHHVDTPPMHSSWVGSWRPGSTLQDTYSIFSEMRRRGVKAHSWV